MAENLTIARPYANAAFETALEQNDLDKWQNLLEAMSIACSDDFFLDHLKLSPNSTIASDSLISLLKDLVDDYGANFIRIIGENNRFNVIPQIYEEFLRLRQDHDKTIVCQLVCAHEYSQDEIDLLTEKLAKKYGKQVTLQIKIDPSLIGGAILKVGDKVIDASVQTSINNLSSTLR